MFPLTPNPSRFAMATLFGHHPMQLWQQPQRRSRQRLECHDPPLIPHQRCAGQRALRTAVRASARTGSADLPGPRPDQVRGHRAVTLHFNSRAVRIRPCRAGQSFNALKPQATLGAVTLKHCAPNQPEIDTKLTPNRLRTDTELTPNRFQTDTKLSPC